MILSDIDILKLLKDPAHADERKQGGALESDFKQHVTGENYSDGIDTVTGYESPEQAKIKKQLSKPATVEIMNIVISDLSRWTNTQGTFKKYHFENDEVEKNFKDSLENVWRGSSLDYMMKKFHKEAMFTEFAGFYVVTKPEIVVIEGRKYSVREGIQTAYDESDLIPYVIFICNEDILDYYLCDNKVEYLIYKFKEEQNGKVKDVYYRIIDDKNDSLYVCPGGDRTKAKMFVTVVNEAEQCTAVPVSTFNLDADDDLVKVSPVNHLLPLLSRYQNKDAELTRLEVLHNYPKLAVVRVECKKCGHTGEIVDEATGEKYECPTCKGIGYVSPISADGVILLPQAIPSDASPYPGSPATYITPDVASLQYADTKLKTLRDIILYSGTGNKNLVSENIFTATEVVSNTRSLEDKVGEIIDSVETIETKLTLLIAKLSKTYRNIFKGSSIRYGRKLNIRDESVILLEIKDSKIAGMPESHIENLQKELISSRYRNSDEERERNLILADLEPYCFLSVSEVLSMRDLLNKELITLKLNFNESIDWFESVHGDIREYFADKDREKTIMEVRNILKDEISKDNVLPGSDDIQNDRELLPNNGSNQGAE